MTDWVEWTEWTCNQCKQVWICGWGLRNGPAKCHSCGCKELTKGQGYTSDEFQQLPGSK